MVMLYYQEDDENINGWKERLERMAIKHALIEREALSKPLLQYGKDSIEGREAINTYLDELEEIVRSWYECRCDKHDFN